MKPSEATQHKTPPVRSNRNNNRQKLNFRNVTLHDLLANYHVSHDNEPNSDDTTTEVIDEVTEITSLTDTNADNNDQLLIQAVKSNNNNNKSLPADVRNLLSFPVKSPSANSTKTTSINVSEIIYKITKYDTSSSI